MKKVLLRDLSGALRWDKKGDGRRKKTAAFPTVVQNNKDDDTVPSAKNKQTEKHFHAHLNKKQMSLK